MDPVLIMEAQAPQYNAGDKFVKRRSQAPSEQDELSSHNSNIQIQLLIRFSYANEKSFYQLRLIGKSLPQIFCHVS